MMNHFTARSSLSEPNLSERLGCNLPRNSEHLKNMSNPKYLDTW